MFGFIVEHPIITSFIVLVALSILLPADSTDKSRFNRSGLSLYIDNKTKLHYIKASMFGNLIPRMDENGKQMRGDE